MSFRIKFFLIIVRGLVYSLRFEFKKKNNCVNNKEDFYVYVLCVSIILYNVVYY